jgi:hypothetical protein
VTKSDLATQLDPQLKARLDAADEFRPRLTPPTSIPKEFSNGWRRLTMTSLLILT